VRRWEATQKLAGSVSFCPERNVSEGRMLPSMRGDSVESRRELERLRREKRAWQSERKQIRKHLEQIERACRHALPHVRGTVVLERDREQLKEVP
jgi:hypothetical protein